VLEEQRMGIVGSMFTKKIELLADETGTITATTIIDEVTRFRTHTIEVNLNINIF
jgi:hypothetical protein